MHAIPRDETALEGAERCSECHGNCQNTVAKPVHIVNDEPVWDFAASGCIYKRGILLLEYRHFDTDDATTLIPCDRRAD